MVFPIVGTLFFPISFMVVIPMGAIPNFNPIVVFTIPLIYYSGNPPQVLNFVITAVAVYVVHFGFIFGIRYKGLSNKSMD